MKFLKNRQYQAAQTAMEYMLILTVVGVIVLAGLKYMVPQVNHSAEGQFNSVTRVILGEKPQPIDGHWCQVECPTAGTTGNPVRFRTCECPAPAFGGLYCTESDGGTEKVTCPGVTPVDVCVDDGSCSAPIPNCGQVTFGKNNCGQACTRRGASCQH